MLVDAVFFVSVTASFAVSVVNPPVLFVAAPIGVLSIAPANIDPPTPSPPVTTTAPLPLPELAVDELNVVLPLALSVVNLPVPAVVAPTLMPSMLPAVSEVIVTVSPDPITTGPPGSIVTELVGPVGDILIVCAAAVKSKLPGNAVGLPASPSVIDPVVDAKVKSPAGLIVACPPG